MIGQSLLRRIFLIAFIIRSTFIFSQTNSSKQIDSLKNLLNTQVHDTIKAKAYINLVMATGGQSDPEKNLFYSKQALALLEKHIQEVNEQVKNNVYSLKASALNNIAYAYRQEGNIPLSISFDMQSLKIREQINDQFGIACSYNNLAITYTGNGDIKKAKDLFFRSYQYLNKIDDKAGKSYTLNNIASLLSRENNFDSSIALNKLALEIRKEVNDSFGIAQSYYNLGDNFELKKDTATALDYYNKALKVGAKINSDLLMSYALNRIAKINLATRRYSLARTNSEAALLYAKKSSNIEIIRQIARNLSSIYDSLHDWRNAYRTQILFKQMDDSLNNQSNRKAILQKSFQYEYEKKTATDSLKALNERKVFSAKLEQERTQRYSLYAGMILIAIFSLFIFNRFRITKRQKRIIESQKEQVDEAYEKLHEKNKEVLDSIHYAKRIQNALLPTKKYVEREMNRLKNTNK